MVIDMNISEVTSILRIVLMFCAAGAVISGIVKARQAKKNGRSQFFCIGSIAVGVILAMLSIVLVICLGSALDSSGEYIKAQYPIGVSNITYGQALDKVCGNQKWYQMGSESSSSGKAIVQMEADCNYDGAVRKITIQFSYGVRDLEQIDADTPFEITFVGFDDSTQTSVSVMQDLMYEMFAHYAADNAMELDASVKNTILYSSGWNIDKIMSNAAGTTPQENDAQDDEGAETPVYSNKNDSKNEEGKNSDKDSDEGEMLEKDARELVYQWLAENPVGCEYVLEPSMEYEQDAAYPVYWYTLWLNGYDYELLVEPNGALSIGAGRNNEPIEQWYNEMWLPYWLAASADMVTEDVISSEEDARAHIEQWFAENPLIYYDYEIELSDEWISGVEQGAYWFDLYIGDLFYDIIWIDTVTGGISMGEGDMSVPMDQWYAETWLPLMGRE